MSARATVEHHENGMTVFAGADAVALYQLMALRSALGLELKGLRLSRGASALKTAKRMTGLRTNDRNAQIAALSGMIDSAHGKVQHIVQTKALIEDHKKAVRK